METPEPVAATTPLNTEAQTAEVMAMTPHDALAELAEYVRHSIQGGVFGKTRAQAAVVVLRDAIGDDDA